MHWMWLKDKSLDDNTLLDLVLLNVRPQVSLTAPNCDHFGQVSLAVFWMQLPQLKNLFVRETGREIFSN